MSGVETTIVVMLVLFPGFLAWKVAERIGYQRERSEFDKLFLALAFTLVIYMIYALLAFAAGRPPVPQVHWGSILLLFVLTMVVGFVAGKTSDWNLLGKLDGWLEKKWKLRLTWKVDTTTVWRMAFREYHSACWAEVHLKDGTVIEGWAKYYSDDPEDGEIWLSRAPEDKEHGWSEKPVEVSVPGLNPRPIGGPCVLIPKQADVSYVAFVDTEEGES